MLGEVEETIYVVEEDEDEEETIRVSKLDTERTNPWATDGKLANTPPDNSQEVRDAVCQRFVSLPLFWLSKVVHS